MKPSLAVMTLVYRRAFVLRAIQECLRRLNCRVSWQIAVSPRVSSDVLGALRDLETRGGSWTRPVILEAPISPLGATEQFMALRQWQLERAPPSEWGVLWDDDQVLEDAREAAEAVRDPTTDLIYATKAYFWDNDSSVATHLPSHRSVFLFRRRDGDRFPDDRVIHAPRSVHDNPRKVVDLCGKLLDFGYMRYEDRQRVWAEYKRVGKIDPVTLSLIAERPPVERWTGPYPLRARP